MKNSLRKLTAIFMVVMLLVADVAAMAEAAGTLILPGSLEVIEEEAFMGDTSITHVVVPEGATAIGPRAFAGSSVSSIELPSTIETIDDTAFDDCGDITVTAPEGSKAYEWAVEKGYIEEEPSEVEFTTWYDEDEERLYITGYYGSVTELTVPAEIDGVPVYAIDGEAFGWRPLEKVVISEGIQRIGGSAFCGCTELTEVVLPSTLKYIGSYAFEGCDKLASIELPYGLETINPGAFYSCDSLTSISIPGTVEYIGEEAFCRCLNLTDVTIGEGVSEIQYYAFARTGISSIDLPDSLIAIAESAFEDCESLTGLHIPANVDTISGNPAPGCASLTGFTVAEGNENFKAVNGVLYNSDCSEIYAVPAAKTGDFDIPASVKVIGSCAFNGCESLDRINITAEVSDIGDGVFTDCSADIYAYPNSYAAQWLIENSVPFNYFDSAAGDFTYSVNSDGTVTLTGYTGSGGMVVIPANLDGMAVTAIGDNAFDGIQTITSIIIPEGIKTIGEGAFANCAYELHLDFPASVTSIGEGAIEGGIAVEITAAADSFMARWCDENGFYYTQAGTENLYYSTDDNGNITITGYNGNDRVFAVPAAIKGSPVVAIAESAFDYCDNLTEIYIPASVASIGAYAFRGCDKLRTINVDAGNTVYASVDGVVYSKDMKQLLICPPGKRGTVTVAAGVTEIMEFAFYSCSYVTGVVLPDSLVSIGDSAFSNCYDLESVELPAALTYIGDSAFSNCYNIESIELPAALTYIGGNAFYCCEELTSVTIPAAVTYIGYGAFADCYGLEEVIFAEGSQLETIEEDAFAWANVESLDLPESLQTIGDGAFRGNRLTSVTIPASVTSFGESVFSENYDLAEINVAEGSTSLKSYDGILYSYGGAVLTFCPPARSGEVVVADGTVTIDGGAFRWCDRITSVTVPEGVTTISDYAFEGCTNLMTAYLPASVTEIQEEAFSDCSILIIYAPEGSYAAEYAVKYGFVYEEGVLESDHPYEDDASEIWNYVHPEEAYALCLKFSRKTAFEHDYDFLYIIDEEGNEKEYSGDSLSGASVYLKGDSFTLRLESDISEQRFGFRILSIEAVTKEEYAEFGAFSTALRDDGTYEITDYHLADTDVVIPATIGGIAVTAIGESAFSYSDITSVVIPEGVTEIGYSAFNSCESLASVTLPSTIRTLGGWSFHGCTALTGIDLPEGLTTMENDVFSGSGLTSITLPDSLTTMSNGCFSRCYYLAEVNLGSGLTWLDEGVFWETYALKSIVIPSCVTSIYENCFIYSGLESIVIPEGVTYIGSSAFYNNYSLTDVTLPASLNSIGSNAFDGCSNIEITAPEGSYAYNWAVGKGFLREDVVFESEHPVTSAIDRTWTYTAEGAYALALNFSDKTRFYNEAYIEITDGEGKSTTYYNSNPILGKPAFVMGDSFTLRFVSIDPENNYFGFRLMSVDVIADETAFNNYGGYVTETLDDGTLSITGYTGTQSVLEIPSEIGGVAVTDIANEAFYEHDRLTRVTIPGSVETIGDYAFYNCNYMTELIVSEGVGSIGYGAFADGYSLYKASLPASLESIGDGAFDYCYNLEITAPEGSYAYEWAYTNGFLTEDAVFESEHPVTTEIDRTWTYTAEGAYALALNFSSKTNFYNEAYIEINYGDTTEYYYSNQLRSNPVFVMDDSFTLRFVSTDTWNEYFGFRLVSVDVLADETAYDNYGGFTTETLDDGTLSITGYTGMQSVIEIPSEIGGVAVTDIANEAFRQNDRLTHVTIPGSVETIGDYAFYNCNNLKELTIGEGVVNIYYGAFADCYGLYKASLPASIEYIGGYVFNYCNNLEITAPEGSYAYEWAENKGYAHENVILESSHPYEPDSDDTWEYVYDGEAYALAVTFSGKTSFEDNYDFLHITDADGNTVRYSGDSLAGRTIAVMGNSFTLRLESDVSEQRYGFRITDVRPLTEDEVENMGGYTYNVLEDGAAEITGYTGFKSALTIPAEIDGYAVTRIADSAFADSSITSVVIPEGVTEIGYNAFINCVSLNSVTLPSTIRILGGWSFHGCTALTGITLPEGLTTMEDDVFSGSGLTSITLPDSLTSMRNGCFSRCYDLAEVNLGSGLTWLDEGVFWENYALTSIVIPDCVTEIYDNCFYYSGLVEITIPASVTNFRYGSSFEDCNSLSILHTTQGSYAEQFFAENMPDVLIFYMDGTMSETPAEDFSFTVIDGEATITAYNGSAKAVVVPKQLAGAPVTAIGEYAFESSYVKYVVLQEGIETIGDCAFRFSYVSHIEFPTTLRTIGDSAFYGVCYLTSIELPEGLETIGYESFGSSDLTSVSFPSTLVSIGEYAFANNNYLKTVTIPANVAEIVTKAFFSCSSLTDIYVDENNTAYKSVDGVLYSADGKTLEICPTAKSGYIYVEEGTETIADYAFFDCDGLYGITLPNGLRKIGDSAFKNCELVTELVIPDSVVSIGEYALGLPGMTSLVLSETLTDIDWCVLNGADSLTSLHIPASVTYINDEGLLGCPALAEITVAPENTCFVSIDGMLFSADGTKLYWCSVQKEGEVVIPDTVTELAGSAFSDCAKITGVVIPDGVTFLADWLFDNCVSLESVTIPASVETIESIAFNGCSDTLVIRGVPGSYAETFANDNGYTFEPIAE